MKLRLFFLLALGLPLVIAAAAPALVIETGDENTSAPSPDPGWANVGSRSAYGAVYLGAGWVLTAGHVGPGDTYFGGLLYPWAPGSDVQLSNPPPGTGLADLVLFRLAQPYPPLPALALSIPAAAPAVSNPLTPLVIIARGCKRGDPTTWNPPGPESYDGYLWGLAGYMRWGKNFVEVDPYFEPDFGGTKVFGSVFDQSGSGHSPQEVQGAAGDSGGAVFVQNGSSYDLAGILIGIAGYRNPDQPPQTALYGNSTFAADLSVYRDQIVATMPEPVGGLWAGMALLAALASAGTRRACRGTGSAASSPPRA